MNRSYHEMMQLESFLERLEYLQLHQEPFGVPFGPDRYLNQKLYKFPEWRSVREKVIVRDRSCDLAHPDHEIIRPPVYIHHINPITANDILERSPKLFDLDNLVMTTYNTHQAIHYGSATLYKMEITERTPNDTCPWKK